MSVSQHVPTQPTPTQPAAPRHPSARMVTVLVSGTEIMAACPSWCLVHRPRDG